MVRTRTSRSGLRRPGLRVASPCGFALATVIVSWASVLAGCPSVARFNRAAPIGKGQLEVTVAPALAGPSDGFKVDTEGEPYVGSEGGINWFPSLDLEARYGLSAHVDGAVTLRNMGTTFGLDLKLALAHGRAGAIAFDPAVQVGLNGSYLGFEAPLLFDVRASRVVTLTLALQYTGLWVVDVGFEHLVGGTFGVEIVVTDFLRVQPYVSVFVWLDPPNPDYTARYFSGGLAFKLPLGAKARATQ